MTKRLTYKQRVRRAYPAEAFMLVKNRAGAWTVFGSLSRDWERRTGAVGNACTRRRDAWRSAWRNLRRKK